MNLLTKLILACIIPTSGIHACTPPEDISYPRVIKYPNSDFISRHVYPTYASEFPGSAQNEPICYGAPTDGFKQKSGPESDCYNQGQAVEVVAAVNINRRSYGSNRSSSCAANTSSERMRVNRQLIPDCLPEQ